ncbi:hypothetical protein B0J13DRAFT_30467 [Dactylonectria estremocensis]|uniref:Uncharacterized protein n=1 Tax=Dactylonectria estremocensis TaxID=1079267 RepID=A0A9P9JIS8_9HYPO|nr:hypothetical protein B0J13DRAFT_30467 [Dactylonectria estremocensis]
MAADQLIPIWAIATAALLSTSQWPSMLHPSGLPQAPAPAGVNESHRATRCKLRDRSRSLRSARPGIGNLTCGEPAIGLPPWLHIIHPVNMNCAPSLITLSAACSYARCLTQHLFFQRQRGRNGSLRTPPSQGSFEATVRLPPPRRRKMQASNASWTR